MAAALRILVLLQVALIRCRTIEWFAKINANLTKHKEAGDNRIVFKETELHFQETKFNWYHPLSKYALKAIK